MFIVLPFSFSSAPFIVIKAMPCLVKILEKVSDKKFAYLLATVLDPPLPFPLIRLSTSETEFVKNSLTQCGFITKGTYLGGNNISINLRHSRLAIPENKILLIMESIQFTIKR